MIEWQDANKNPPPKDRIFLAKTIFCGIPDLMLLHWVELKIGKQDRGYWDCKCGCQQAEDCFIGDITHWMDIPND